ncbi:MAG: carboxymuconolactone decarboxylase family protein [Alphaproteobacteria bacterium]
MPRIPLVNDDTANPEAGATLSRFKELWQGDWNLARVLANAPALADAFGAFWDGLQKTSLRRADREVIALEMAVTNDCHYCKPAHIMVAREHGLPDDRIKDVLSGRLVSDPRGRLIQRLVRRVMATKGKLSDREFEEFQAQGLTQREMLEVVGEIAVSTLTNFTNRLAQTETDDFLKGVRI